MVYDAEDELVFTDPDGKVRILRGIIVAQTSDFVILQRRDGDHQIARKMISKIVSRSSGPGFVKRAIDLARTREETIQQNAASKMAEAVRAVLEAEDRGDPAERIALLRRQIREAEKAWRESR